MKLFKKVVKIAVIFIIFLCLGFLGLYIYCLFTPKIEITRNQSYYLYDNEGNLLFNNYSWVELDDISPYLIDATLSTEDKHFYYHIGFDFIRIGKAMINNITSRSLSEGASTITQQYARNLYFISLSIKLIVLEFLIPLVLIKSFVFSVKFTNFVLTFILIKNTSEKLK